MLQWLASINYAPPGKPLSTRDLNLFLIIFFYYVSTILKKISISNKNGAIKQIVESNFELTLRETCLFIKNTSYKKFWKLRVQWNGIVQMGVFNKNLRSFGFKMVDFQAFIWGLKIYKNLDEVSRLKFFRNVI